MHVCKIWENDLTEYRFDIGLQNFKKPLDIFLPQIEGKRSKEYFIIILAVKERFDLFFFCLEFIFENCKHREPV